MIPLIIVGILEAHEAIWHVLALSRTERIVVCVIGPGRVKGAGERGMDIYHL